MSDLEKAKQLLHEFKGKAYLNGTDVLSQAGYVVAELGRQAVLVYDVFPNADSFVDEIKASFVAADVKLIGEITGARPNAPREDVHRISIELTQHNPEVILSFGGGSTLDAVKAAEVIHTLGGDIEDYFGTGLVTKSLLETGKTLTPHVAIQTASSSGSHLTKYSNITDLKSGQKKLIVDEAVVPIRSIFDYNITREAPLALSSDGAMDGIAHLLEVLYSSVEKNNYTLMEEVAYAGIRLVVQYLPSVITDPSDIEGREALGLATDLGGYAIMVGGTNGGHLTSFSLVDVLSHGRACAIMNPYYTIFFAPAIQDPLKLVGKIFREAGYTDKDIDELDGRALGQAVASAMIEFAKRIGFPTTLGEIAGFTDEHIERALRAAKTPELKMKLENMPVPLTADLVEEYMRPVLEAAKMGDFDLIKNIR